MLPRPALTARVIAAIRRSPAALLLGPRQCGKTTLARTVASTTEHVSYFDPCPEAA
jgi:predicted AAA+ superfamily ATPase